MLAAGLFKSATGGAALASGLGFADFDVGAAFANGLRFFFAAVEHEV